MNICIKNGKKVLTRVDNEGIPKLVQALSYICCMGAFKCELFNGGIFYIEPKLLGLYNFNGIPTTKDFAQAETFIKTRLEYKNGQLFYRR